MGDDYPSQMILGRLSVAFLSLISVLGCEESLPPRIDPRNIDPASVLELSSEAVGGVVRFEPRDSVSRSDAGTVILVVKNIHDEVLSGQEGISIDMKFWLKDFPIAETLRVQGDRDNLINPFNFQGNVFMLDGDVLTIDPDSSAIFLVGLEHTKARFWEFGNPTYVVDPCGFPPCDERVVTEPLEVVASGSVRLFANQEVPLVTSQIGFSVFYFFITGHQSTVIIDSLEGSFEASGAVTIHWRTTYEYHVLGFKIEKSIFQDSGFTTVTESLIPAEGGSADTATYVFTDFQPESGAWYYRAAVVEDLFIAGPFAVTFSEPVLVEVP